MEENFKEDFLKSGDKRFSFLFFLTIVNLVVLFFVFHSFKDLKSMDREELDSIKNRLNKVEVSILNIKERMNSINSEINGLRTKVQDFEKIKDSNRKQVVKYVVTNQNDIWNEIDDLDFRITMLEKAVFKDEY